MPSQAAILNTESDRRKDERPFFRAVSARVFRYGSDLLLSGNAAQRGSRSGDQWVLGDHLPEQFPGAVCRDPETAMRRAEFAYTGAGTAGIRRGLNRFPPGFPDT